MADQVVLSVCALKLLRHSEPNLSSLSFSDVEHLCETGEIDNLFGRLWLGGMLHAHRVAGHEIFLRNPATGQVVVIFRGKKGSVVLESKMPRSTAIEWHYCFGMFSNLAHPWTLNDLKLDRASLTREQMLSLKSKRAVEIAEKVMDVLTIEQKEAFQKGGVSLTELGIVPDRVEVENVSRKRKCTTCNEPGENKGFNPVVCSDSHGHHHVPFNYHSLGSSGHSHSHANAHTHHPDPHSVDHHHHFGGGHSSQAIVPNQMTNIAALLGATGMTPLMSPTPCFFDHSICELPMLDSLDSKEECQDPTHNHEHEPNAGCVVEHECDKYHNCHSIEEIFKDQHACTYKPDLCEVHSTQHRLNHLVIVNVTNEETFNQDWSLKVRDNQQLVIFCECHLSDLVSAKAVNLGFRQAGRFMKPCEEEHVHVAGLGKMWTRHHDIFLFEKLKSKAADSSNSPDVADQVVPETESQFRDRILSQFGSRCIVSESGIVVTLDAVPVAEWDVEGTKDTQSPGILLRKDLRALFEEYLLGFRIFNPSNGLAQVCLNHQVAADDQYRNLNGKMVTLPLNVAWQALAKHFQQYDQKDRIM
eukprot:comp20586_c0_seq1/m.41847 comp20586_c0_seq1/g.41847  ORF comp20586_c0_seq1/g.41847 comp20586_c0_seq1/m.41847 type:complete len:585 (+) comp20586_c0_seq1:39-1793(+)